MCSLRLGVCSMIYQLVDNLHVSLVAGRVQRSEAVVVTNIQGVRVGSNTQKPTDLWPVVLSSRLDHFYVNTNHSFFLSSMDQGHLLATTA